MERSSVKAWLEGIDKVTGIHEEVTTQVQPCRLAAPLRKKRRFALIETDTNSPRMPSTPHGAKQRTDVSVSPSTPMTVRPGRKKRRVTSLLDPSTNASLSSSAHVSSYSRVPFLNFPTLPSPVNLNRNSGETIVSEEESLGSVSQHSPTRSVTRSTQHTRSSSPVKRSIALAKVGGGIRWLSLSNNGNELGERGRILLRQLTRAANRVGFLTPFAVEAFGFEDVLEHQMDGSDRRSISSLSREAEEVRRIVTDTERCKMEEALEPEWNNAVHGQVLRLALQENAPYVGYRCVTSSKMDPRWLPQVDDGTTSQTITTGKMVDYCMVLQLPPPQSGVFASLAPSSLAIASDVHSKRLRALGNSIRHPNSTLLSHQINGTDDNSLMYNPVVASIETKTISRTEEEARVQLSIWLASQLSRIRRVVRDQMPTSTEDHSGDHVVQQQQPHSCSNLVQVTKDDTGGADSQQADSAGGGFTTDAGASNGSDTSNDFNATNNSSGASDAISEDNKMCRSCGSTNHFAIECDAPRKTIGECFRCGKVDHPTPTVDRPEAIAEGWNGHVARLNALLEMVFPLIYVNAATWTVSFARIAPTPPYEQSKSVNLHRETAHSTRQPMRDTRHPDRSSVSMTGIPNLVPPSDTGTTVHAGHNPMEYVLDDTRFHVYNSLTLGSTTTELETYQLLKSLRELSHWAEQEFARWWSILLDLERDL